MELIRIEKLEGRGIPVRGDEMDTDRIIPARFLKEITFSRMGEYPFFDERFTEDGKPKEHPLNRPEFAGASFLVVNANFGCGSSREHAPQALMRWGIKAVIAESLAEIFAGNCTMIGVPSVTLPGEDIRKLQDHLEKNPAEVMLLDLRKKTLSCGPLFFNVNLPETRRQSFLEGTWDSTALLLANLPEARRTAASLPYQNRFTTI